MASTPTREFLRKRADERVRRLVKEQGPGFGDDAVFEVFAEWVLPDRDLQFIRERIERWRAVAERRRR
jgi:hypothetical protein